MATYKQLVSEWDKAGRPRDINSIHKLIIDAGLDDAQASSAFSAAGLQAPTKEPDLDEVQTENNDNVEIPIGYTITSKTGKEFTWKGAQWTSKGKIVSSNYKDLVTKAAKDKIVKDEALAATEKQNAANKIKQSNDAEHEFESDDVVSKPTSTPLDDDSLLQIANIIKSNPKKDMIMNLLSKNDNIADLAASVQAQGMTQQVIELLSSKE